MEIKFEKKTLRNLLLIILGVIVVYWVLNESERVSAVTGGIWDIFSPFVIGAVLAFILNVPMRAFERLYKKIGKVSFRRTLALVSTILCVLLVLALVFILLIPQLLVTGESLFNEIGASLGKLQVTINEFLNTHPDILTFISDNLNLQSLDWGSMAQKAWDVIESGLSTLLPQTFTVIGNLASGVFSAFISAAFAIYALFQKETLARQGRKLLYAILPERISDYTVRVMRMSNSTFSNFLSGQCLEVCILGLMFAVSMAIFRMPYIPLISVLVAVTAFIPVVGAWIGCIIGAFLILASNLSDPLLAVWFVVLFLVLQQLENNFIYPRVVGTSIGLSGMWVLIAVSLGGSVGGVSGMFLMIPVTSVIYTLVSEWIQSRLAKRQIDGNKLEAQPPELRSHLRTQRDKTKKKWELKKLLKRKKKDNK